MQQSDWQAFLFKTTTGAIGPRVEPKDGSFSLSLAGASSASFQLDKSDLIIIDRDTWLESWWGGIVYVFQGRPVYAGPIINQPKEYNEEIHFGSEDVRAILARRIAIAEHHLDSPNIAKGVTQFKGLSLGTIAQEVVKLGMAKPGGNLPIEFVSKRESAKDDADHQRTYKAYNANNLNIDEVLTKIQEVSGGPDIMFRPRMINAARLVWDMHHGTEDDHRIKQTGGIVPEFDLTAPMGQTDALEIVETSAHIVDRSISVGGGTNEKTVMSVSEDLSRVRRGFPLLEDVTTISDSENRTVVRNHAIRHRKQFAKPLREFTLTADAYGEYPLGTFWPGDMVIIHCKNWFNVPDGPNKFRLLAITGAYGSTKIRMSLQLDSQWDY